MRTETLLFRNGRRKNTFFPLILTCLKLRELLFRIELLKQNKKGWVPATYLLWNILENPFENVIHPFKLPKSRAFSLNLPSKLIDPIANRLFQATVSFNFNKCELCGTCWKNCPVQAITPPSQLKMGNLPKWNQKKCITCYCCGEFCPYEAVNFKINIPKNVFRTWLGWACIAIIAAVVGLLIWIL